MQTKALYLQQINEKIRPFVLAGKISPPPTGWIKAVRLALGMSLQQLAGKLKITRQSAGAIEKREREGAITLNALREAARAMDMELVYGFVPIDGSMDALIDRKARELATRIVLRTDQTMKLEDQENSRKRLRKAIEERTKMIRHQMPGALWD